MSICSYTTISVMLLCCRIIFGSHVALSEDTASQTIGSGIGVRCTVGSKRSHLLSKVQAGFKLALVLDTRC